MVWLREIPHVALTHAHQDHVGGSGGKFPHELFCDWNNNSLVVHLQFGSRSILLPGTLKKDRKHTSELQSLTNIVCRLLLEKKKKEQYRCRQRDAPQSTLS